MARLAAGVIILLIFSLPPTQGVAPAKEYVIWMTLPKYGVDSIHVCTDTIPGPLIHELAWLRYSGYGFNPARLGSFIGSIGVSGKEGDSLGVGIDLPAGAAGAVDFWAVNNIGESCKHSFVFVVPPDTANMPPPSDQLTAEYYDNEDFTALFDVLPDGTISHNWYSDAPLPGMGVDQFSIRWTGQLRTSETGTFRLCLEVCNGNGRLDLSGATLSDFPASGCVETCRTVQMTAGTRYPVLVEYRHDTGNAKCSMRWITPSWRDEVIPPSAWQ